MQIFASRPAAASAAVTAALLTWMELSDAAVRVRDDDQVDDAGTSRRFLVAIGIAAAVTTVEAARIRPIPTRRSRWWAGLLVLWAGAAVNRAARRELAGAYRPRLTIVDGHQVATGGPYAVVRHPMYAGGSLVCVGAALAIGTPAAAVAWSLPVAALVDRIRVEESLLERHLGSSYGVAMGHRARLVPGVW